MSAQSRLGYDQLNGVPLVVSTGAVHVRADPHELRYDLLEPAEGLPLQSILRRVDDTETLVVSLHGALDRVRYEIPRFERRASFAGLRAHQLFLADPTLALSTNVRIGWYLGTAEDDVTVRYAAFVHDVARQLGVTRTILVGGSGGGFAAMALSTRLPDSLAVTFSPQVNIGRFGEAWSATLLKYAFPDFVSYDEAAARFPTRFDIAALLRSRTGGRIWYIQNSGDTAHIESQLNPFRDEMGSDDRVQYVSEFHCSGHNPPTADRVRAWTELACRDPWAVASDFALV